ncbi:MAG TPA: hypothetical protein VFY26_13760 [Anaerolineales bacterium]|nr:hypothetical protein [Anaerolineales bacterium]
MSGKQVSIILVSISFILAVLFLFLLSTGDTAFRVELLKEAARTILQLLLVGMLGAFATFLFTEYAADRDKRIQAREREDALQADQHRSRLEALNTLTRLYWETRKAFDIIDAHRSAKSYGEQMRQIIDYRTEFQRLDNEIVAGMYAVENEETRNSIGKCLFQMIQLLKQAIEEWKTQYLRLSRLQLQDEKQEDPQMREVPREIDNLPVLAQLRQDNFQTLHDLFEEAAGPLREQLRFHMKSTL